MLKETEKMDYQINRVQCFHYALVIINFEMCGERMHDFAILNLYVRNFVCNKLGY